MVIGNLQALMQLEGSSQTLSIEASKLNESKGAGTPSLPGIEVPMSVFACISGLGGPLMPVVQLFILCKPD